MMIAKIKQSALKYSIVEVNLDLVSNEFYQNFKF